MSEPRAFAKDHGLWGYSRLKKAELISSIRFHNESARTPVKEGAQKQFDPEESDNKE